MGTNCNYWIEDGITTECPSCHAEFDDMEASGFQYCPICGEMLYHKEHPKSYIANIYGIHVEMPMPLME